MLAPLPEGKWSFATAAHFLNRAGFGGTPDEIEAVQRAGLIGAVERLLHPPADAFEPGEAQPWHEPENLRSRMRDLRSLKSKPDERKDRIRALRLETRDELLDLRVWWLSRMQSSPAPLVEKMTLFWHGHFATSVQKVKNAYWMWRQNQTFRRHALGNFQTLLHEISRDPAMMIYLDLARSQRKHPNENWAREVMELFTLGIGHYTRGGYPRGGPRVHRLPAEPDEPAIPLRPQPGRRRTEEVSRANREFFRRRHSRHHRRATGLRGMDRAQTLPVFCRRRSSVCRSSTAVADSLRKNNFELRPVLREIFTLGRILFRPRRCVRRSKARSSSSSRAANCSRPICRRAIVTQNALQQMGQVLFAPPNVKGWDGGKSWISTSTLLFRYNFANYLLNGAGKFRPGAPAALRGRRSIWRKSSRQTCARNRLELIAHLARRFLPGPA